MAIGRPCRSQACHYAVHSVRIFSLLYVEIPGFCDIHIDYKSTDTFPKLTKYSEFLFTDY